MNSQGAEEEDEEPFSLLSSILGNDTGLSAKRSRTGP